jgi:hypothetical protein
LIMANTGTDIFMRLPHYYAIGRKESPSKAAELMTLDGNIDLLHIGHRVIPAAQT